MWWVVIGALTALGCYILGYVIGSVVTSEKINTTRKEMSLDVITEEDNSKTD